MTGKRHIARYRPGADHDPDDPRLTSPSFPRNAPPMIATLSRLLGDRSGRVLEIGAGTGQHAAAFALAFPSLVWVPSDPDPVHRASIAAWARSLDAPAPPPIALDAASDWAKSDEIRALGPLTAVVAMNVLHIAPIAVAHGILRGAGHVLAPDGLLIFYGPFRVDGAHTGPGNAAFDRDLRADNPEWGVRDVDEIAEAATGHGLTLDRVLPMPADNRVLVFGR